MAFWSRMKPIEAAGAHEQRLKRTLSWPHLVALGVGAIVGAGIYALIGQGAGLAGPGVILSFAIAGLVCACASLAYAELAAMMPASGSAYTYSYAALGELVAWIVGWALILEYTVVVSAVAVGWSGYAAGFAQNNLGLAIPQMIPLGEIGQFKIGPVALPAWTLHFNPYAVIIIAIVAGLLVLGTRESATVNAILVVIKIAALLLFLALAFPHFSPARFEPIAPYGFGATEQGDGKVGIMAAASLIFFAFYGFDAVSTAAEEAKKPARDLTIGIIGSMAVCTLLYMAVGAAAIGAMNFRDFAESGEPIALILRTLGHPGAANLVGAAAIVAMPTVLLAFLYGQTRIFFVMSRDGLLPRALGGVHARLGTPVAVTIATAIVCAALAGLLTLGEIALLANAGTLAAFIAVSVSLLVLRVREPRRERPFRTPLAWVIAPVAIAGCLYLFTSLSSGTIQRFFIWMAIGLVAYFLWGVRKSALAGSRIANPSG
jgi:APA family basic amino acid/polyamine antiporter